MRVRFLLDENLPRTFQIAVVRKHPQLDILRVGDPTCPPLQSPDEVILEYLVEARRVLVTRNRKSMPGHVARLEARGLHHWGIFQVKAGTTYRRLMDALVLFSEASELEEWIGETVWIPY
jgi:hypothetical protein